MLDGGEGPAVQKAMNLLVRYGDALGAERLVPTNNVCGTFVAAGPMIREFAKQGNDAIFAEFNLDSSERVQMPPVKAYTCHLVRGIDSKHPEMNEAWKRRYGSRRKARNSSAPRASTCSRP